MGVELSRKKHVCKQERTCKCYSQALEPNDNCPIHGYPIPRCDCGRFVKNNNSK